MCGLRGKKHAFLERPGHTHKPGLSTQRATVIASFVAVSAVTATNAYLANYPIAHGEPRDPWTHLAYRRHPFVPGNKGVLGHPVAEENHAPLEQLHIGSADTHAQGRKEQIALWRLDNGHLAQAYLARAFNQH
jgi:hypothetical protein